MHPNDYSVGATTKKFHGMIFTLAEKSKSNSVVNKVAQEYYINGFLTKITNDNGLYLLWIHR